MNRPKPGMSLRPSRKSSVPGDQRAALHGSVADRCSLAYRALAEAQPQIQRVEARVYETLEQSITLKDLPNNLSKFGLDDALVAEESSEFDFTRC